MIFEKFFKKRAEKIEEEKIEEFYNRHILPLIERLSEKKEEIPKISSETLDELREQGIKIEKFLNFLCKEKNILLHGTPEKIQGTQLKPSKMRSSKIFAADKGEIAMISALFKKIKERPRSFAYPYYRKLKKLRIYVNRGKEEEVRREIDKLKEENAKGYIYLIQKTSEFENDPRGSWQYYIKEKEVQPIGVLEISMRDFLHEIKVIGKEEKRKRIRPHPSEK